MPKGDDYLEQLWDEVIDAKGKNQWVTKCLNRKEELSKGAFQEARPALLRLLEQKASRPDLEMLAAFARYETCFEVLVALDDPGLGKSKIAGIHKEFLRSRPKSKARNPKEKFIQWLWETETFTGDDGKWLKALTAKELRMKPFHRLFPAVQRLLQKAKKVKDIGLFLDWNRYEACAETLRLLEQVGFECGDEPVGLHEMLESAYPDDSVPKAKTSTGSGADPTQPLWHLKAAQALALSPDSKTLAIAGASSPIRLCDLATGQERLACEGIRVHIYRIVFSPDGKQVTAGQIDKELSVCDAKTGKLLHKLKRSEDEISGLAHAPTGEILCSSWCGDIAVFDSKTGKALPPLKVNDTEEDNTEVNDPEENDAKEDDTGVMVDAMVLFAKGTRLAALCDGTVTVWSWPERKLLRQIKAADWQCHDMAASPDGKALAVAEQDKGIHLLDATTGKRLGLLDFKDIYQGIAFTPDGSHLILNNHKEDGLSIWNLRSRKEIRKLPLKDSVYGVEVSPDGRFLAAATGRGAFVWPLQPLVTE